MKRVLPGLAIAVSLAALARQPRFLGPPVKKPADGGTRDAGKPLLNPGDEAPLTGGALYNPEAAFARAIQLRDWVGPDAREPVKAVVVTFFATRCEPCKRELPRLQAVYDEQKGKGLRVVSFAIDQEPSAEPAVRELLASHGITFPVVKDGSQLVARQYLGGQTILPAMFVLDGAGKIAFVRQGYEDAVDALRAELVPLLSR